MIPDVNFESKQDNKRKWNGIVWASCKNYIDLIRFLISKGALD